MTLFQTYAKWISTALLACLLVACGALEAVLPAAVDTTSIRIDSDPSGADLFIMGKHAGTTPTIINDRDIYPVTYSAEDEKYYGKIIVRRDGCEEFSKRLTRADISDGITAELFCAAKPIAARSSQTQEAPPTATRATQPIPIDAPAVSSTGSTAQSKPETAPKEITDSSAERKLQQLKSLQQLLDEGLMSKEEEESLRRRIIDAL